MNIYQTTHQSQCPNGQLADTYQIKIKSQATIMVEEIIKTLKDAPNPIYQEALADYLRTKLGTEIAVEGWHHGIFVRCERL